MFKTIYNTMKMKVKLTPQTPLLVSAGKSFDVTRPDMQFFRINTPYGETIYIPGSSIKGVLRAGAEALLSEHHKFSPPVCFASGDMCHESNRRKKRDGKNTGNLPDKTPYSKHCPVCRLFGSGDLASRIEIADVFPFEFGDPTEVKTKKIDKISRLMTSRTGIKIERNTGKTVPGALFEYEVLGGGDLFCQITITNYQLYQPALLLALFKLSTDGFLRFGHSKSRGLGVVDFSIQSVEILQTKTLGQKTIKGIGSLENRNDLGLYMTDRDFIDMQIKPTANALYSTFKIPFEEVKKLETKLNQILVTFLEAGA